MNYDIVIKNGSIVTAEATYHADLGIRGERIAAIGHDLEGAQVIDATDKFVTPGAVDTHVHLSLDLGGGLVSSDDFFTGTRAAALGGTTCVIPFVHPEAEESMLQALERRRAEGDPQVVIDYAFHMNIGPHHLDRLHEVRAVAEAGISTYKLYMAYGYRLDDAGLWRALEAVRDMNGLPVVHAENWEIITALIARHLAEGHTHPRWHPRSRPAIMESEAAGRVIDLATYVGVPVLIFHVGNIETTKRIAAARARGLPVYGETCPQYLFLTDKAFEADGVAAAYPICAPPLRGEHDRLYLWEALARDELQLVSTDHCPWTHAQKEHGYAQNFSKVPGGVPSIEMRFAALYSYGVLGGHFSLNRWVDLCCTTPARLHHLATKGTLAPGYDADIVIFDPAACRALSAETLHENCDWTPYNGLDIQGWPQTVFSRGRVVVQDGKFVGEKGAGRFIPRYT
ncbi:MAG: dihydropyrimidinase [Anaerolineales bacterium]